MMCIAKIRRLMLPEQPQFINPLRLAKNKEHVKGSFSLDSLARLGDILLNKSGEAQYSFSFELDETNICLIKSEIGAKLLLKCQRCLKPVDIEISKCSLLGVYRNLDEFDKLENNYEPYQLDGDLISLKLLVEDEILLAAPMAPVHSKNNCVKGSLGGLFNKKGKRNPFAVLKKLKNN